MIDLSQFDANSVGNFNNNIFGLPFREDEARLIILPVPWEVTVSYSAGTARAPEHIFKAAFQVDLYDPENRDGWMQGFYMRPADKKVLLKSDYLRKEAELYIDYISKGERVEDNAFMSKSLREINEGSTFMNKWVYEQTKDLLIAGKLVGLLGGDHSTPYGYIRALAEKYTDFGILQIDAHCDLRDAYENFTFSHASIMFNVLRDVPQVKRLVQVGVRDYGDQEWAIIENSNKRIIPYFDKFIKERQYEGDNWKMIADEIIDHLPQHVYLSFDVDGLDPKLCPNSGTPVQGGLETEQVFYLLKRLLKSGRKLIGFDLSEVGVGEHDWDANVGARILWRLSNFLVMGNPANTTG